MTCSRLFWLTFSTWLQHFFCYPCLGIPASRKSSMKRTCCLPHFGECCFMLLHPAACLMFSILITEQNTAEASWGKLRQAEAVTVLVLVKKKHDPNMGKRLHAHGNFPQRNFKSWLSHFKSCKSGSKIAVIAASKPARKWLPPVCIHGASLPRCDCQWQLST